MRNLRSLSAPQPLANDRACGFVLKPWQNARRRSLGDWFPCAAATRQSSGFHAGLVGVPISLCLRAPCVEHQHVPQERLVITRTGLMLRPLLKNWAAGEHAIYRRWAQEIASPFFQRAPQPFVNRHGKTHLGAL